ncbi:MAG: fluoride efflux transporter CrcB [Sphingobacteriia bacterium]|nr:fluoride efflux transporter CrcB [Sphingobacteriia bacterium]
MSNCLIVGIGGFIGASARYLINLGFSGCLFEFPIITFGINFTGAFLIGIITQLFSKTPQANPGLLLFLTVGILGGFTTFSTFSLETVNLLEKGKWLSGLVYAGMNKAKRVERANAVLESVQLTDRMTHKPNELSGGQRQRVAVARALVNEPSIILADEPTGNLDSKTSIEIMGLFEQIHELGNTVIVVTHEEDIARHAHRIIRLKDGLVEEDYPNTDIKTMNDYKVMAEQ